MLSTTHLSAQDATLLRAAVRINSILLAVISGLLLGTVVLLATYLSLAKYADNPGRYLSLLAVFFPGYTVSSTGAWIGFFWGFVFGGISGALMYWLYGRILGAKISEQVADEQTQQHLLRPPLLKIAGHPLGLALGVLMALQLIITTGWLVIRGTAEESVHAALLNNYLPGYSVSFSGALLGALQLFAITYMFCLLISAIYNCIVNLRHREQTS